MLSPKSIERKVHRKTVVKDTKRGVKIAHRSGFLTSPSETILNVFGSMARNHFEPGEGIRNRVRVSTLETRVFAPLKAGSKESRCAVLGSLASRSRAGAGAGGGGAGVQRARALHPQQRAGAAARQDRRHDRRAGRAPAGALPHRQWWVPPHPIYCPASRLLVLMGIRPAHAILRACTAPYLGHPCPRVPCPRVCSRPQTGYSGYSGQYSGFQTVIFCMGFPY